MQAPALSTTKPNTSAYERLPRRLKRFVDHYVIGGTAAAALRESGYKGRHANTVAAKWLKRPNLVAAIEEANARAVADIGVRQTTVLKQFAAIATSDPRKLEDADGNTIPLHKLDAETAAAISQVEIEEVSKDGFTGKRYKYKFWDKVKAGDRLGQFVKLWDAKSTTVNVDARSVTVNAGGATTEALQQLADITRAIAALGAGTPAAIENTHGSVLPAALCDGSSGRGASVDVSADSGDPEQT